MEIRLNEIELTNFKGVKSFLFTPMGKSAAILGRNRRGKTTVQRPYSLHKKPLKKGGRYV